MRWVSHKEQIVGSSFLIQFVKRCLLMGELSPLTLSVRSQLEKAGTASHGQQSGVAKPVKVAVGGKIHRRVGKTHFPCEM
jgi:hypothetical protein